MTGKERDALLIAMAQVLVQVLYRLDDLPADERELYSGFLANAIRSAGAEPYPSELN